MATSTTPQAPDFKALNTHHHFELAEHAEVRIDEAREALWIAESCLRMLEESKTVSEIQREAVAEIRAGVRGALSHLTTDLPGCFGSDANGSDVSEMVLTFPRAGELEPIKDEEGEDG